MTPEQAEKLAADIERVMKLASEKPETVLEAMVLNTFKAEDFTLATSIIRQQAEVMKVMHEALGKLIQAKARKDNYGKSDSIYLDMKVEAWAAAHTALALAAPLVKGDV